MQRRHNKYCIRNTRESGKIEHSPLKNKYTGNYYTYYCVTRDTKVAVVYNKDMSLHCNILMLKLKRNEKNKITP